MLLRYGLGDAPGALAIYDRFAEQLRGGLGVSPMPETLALREALRRGDPIVGSIDRRAGYALPFVGRNEELARLTAQWNRAASGEGGAFFLSGESGIGKTRLAGELARVAEAQGARVYTGTTSQPEAAPYQCIAEALRAALPVLVAQPVDRLALGVVAGLVPELRVQIPALEQAAALSPEREVERLFHSMATAIGSLAVARPVLLILEELHWAGDATVDALLVIARHIDRLPVLILATYREEDVPASARSIASNRCAKERAARG